MPTALEIRRQENIAKNRQLLAKVTGRSNDQNNAGVKQIAQKNPGNKRSSQKRTALPKKRVPPSDDETEESRSTKRARSETPQVGLRRSSRNVGKTPDYQAESQTQLPRLVARKIRVDYDRDPNRRSGKRIHDPYDWHIQ
jgi:E3 ubiquitin-protein ligase UHRF1